ncbi:UNVERIFIED_ORG: beta-lactam-binding protein with PASTA domain [Arthrobacter sp. UYEF10]
MKKTLTLIVLTGLLLTGCSGKQASSTSTTVAVVADAVTVPGVLSLTLDKATEQLEGLGLKVEAADTADGKTIISKKNWQVTSQDPTEGAQMAKGSTVHLGVKNLEKVAAEKAAAEKVAADKVAAAAAAPEAAAAAKVVADRAAAEKAAADQAAAQQVAAQKAAEAAAQQAAVKPAPVVQAPAPAAVSYANCAAVRAAGAAPIYAGTPGYGKHLDRDGDGVACEK